ncbi:putative bifunctional diguanylate cyclase/phosphodiesterase [Ornithinibacillus halophilus]|uniref:Diguanylate cyclase (GGDEF) domain-containing protein n=1 Tax=Ornithinibacillus halophilus TaxID=930117 RepID=A0A1M5HSU5_9BACI|nr:EAL domain-containing protein [Ornithinibacillus halophilus]SHG19007.1 diguanylate cyclase (GGDEF) domain-containing protein [Ornithinibacillus halophilus]
MSNSNELDIPFILQESMMQNEHAIIVVDSNGIIIQVNQVFKHSFSFRIGDSINNFFSQHVRVGGFTAPLQDNWKGNVTITVNESSYEKYLDIQSFRIANGEKYFQYVFHTMIEKEEIRYLAYNDGLTKLPNRLAFEENVKQLLLKPELKKHIFALLFFDLDRFKLINDTFGHAYGDLLLQKAAERLQSCFSEKDILARLGGDEFIALLPNIGHEREAIYKVEEIIEHFSIPFQLRENEVYVTISVGISFYPHDGENLEALISQADSAMYHAKKQGKNNYELSKAELHASNFERFHLENMLRKAIKEEQLELFYQPQVNIVDEKVVAVEALVRWRHPEYGIIPPNEFIPIAEDSGLILEIDDFVLRKACQQIHHWKQLGNPIRISVNLSAQQFMQKNLPDKIATLLKIEKVPPNLLELEITESMVMQDTKMSAIQIEKIRALGVKVAIDDFGTGHSSYQYLKNFPIDSLKIDRIFINDVETNRNTKAILNSMINLGHDLNLQVIVEGVETEEQLSNLDSKKCSAVQGYYFYKPMETGRIQELLERKG